MNTKNLLPFTWESYQQRTDKDTAVVTRDGRPVKLAGYNPEAIVSERIVGWDADGECFSWAASGLTYADRQGSDTDLFLLPEKREVFYNVYNNRQMGAPCTSLETSMNYCGPNSVACLCLTYIGDDLQDVQIVHKYPTNP